MLKIIILILIVLVGLFVLWMIYENQTLTTTSYEIYSKRISESNDGTKFVVIADLHNNQFGENNHRLIDKIDDIQPEFIMITGDLFVAKDYNFDYAYDLLKQLAKKYTIFYSYGNHEQKIEEYESRFKENDWKVRVSHRDKKKIQTFKEYKSLVRDLGVSFLDNEDIVLKTMRGGNIHILGGTIGLEYFKRFHRPSMTCSYLKDCFGECHKNEYQILAAHNPMYFEYYAKWGADLILSGHVHGGMVRLPLLGGMISPQMQIFPKYDAGAFSYQVGRRTSNLIVSRGLGIHTLKIRVFNRPELVSVTLKHSTSERIQRNKKVIS